MILAMVMAMLKTLIATVHHSYIPVPQQEQTEIEAIRSVIQKNTSTLPWPQLSKSSVNEFTTENVATMVFPTLFPFGNGDPTAKDRHYLVSFSDSLKNLKYFAENKNDKL